MLLVCDERFAADHDQRPLAYLSGATLVGCDPATMGLWARACDAEAVCETRCGIDRFDHVELNEAFAAQALACVRELKLDGDRVNPHGGAIAVGHPIGGERARIVTHLSQVIAAGESRMCWPRSASAGEWDAPLQWRPYDDHRRHSHAWEYPQHFGDDFRRQAMRARAGVEVDLTVRYEDYRAHVPAGHEDDRLRRQGAAERAVGRRPLRRRLRRASIPTRSSASSALDPTQDGWEREMREGHEELGLRGIKLLPMYAGFRPDDERLDPLWEYATEQRLPVLLHTGTTFVAQAPLECTLPRHLDAVAIRFPDVKIIMAHLGHPYEGECVATFRKHPNVYADISALHYRPFQLYHSLMLVQEYGVWDKVLFGTDYPFTTVNAIDRRLRKLNDMLEGTKLPRLNERGDRER